MDVVDNQGITPRYRMSSVKDFVPNGLYIGTICVLPSATVTARIGGVLQTMDTLGFSNRSAQLALLDSLAAGFAPGLGSSVGRHSYTCGGRWRCRM